jgi:hypothetical protein
MSAKQAILAGHICLDLTPDLSAVPEGQFSTLVPTRKADPSGRRQAQYRRLGPQHGSVLNRLGFPVR